MEQFEAVIVGGGQPGLAAQRKSALLFGVSEDAAIVARALSERP
jgi:hypothetical protein